MTSRRRRLDHEIVRRGLRPDRDAARAAIADGLVLVAGARADNAGRLVAPGESLVVQGPPSRYVGRGGEKLHAALEGFIVDVSARRALDVGASTGGFTDCLLQHGATSVLAVDVGRNQLHERLRADARVRSRERTDIRSVTPDEVDGPLSIATVDVSFTSLARVLPATLALVAPAADLVLLVKPQFEADHEVVSRGRGIVRDPEVWSDVLDRAAGTLRGLGAAIMGAMASPLSGADGNREFFLHARAPGHARADLGAIDAVGLAQATFDEGTGA